MPHQAFRYVRRVAANNYQHWWYRKYMKFDRACTLCKKYAHRLFILKNEERDEFFFAVIVLIW